MHSVRTLLISVSADLCEKLLAKYDNSFNIVNSSLAVAFFPEILYIKRQRILAFIATDLHIFDDG